MLAPLMTLFVLFFKIGLFSFGGGYVMLPLIYQGVQQFGIMSAEEFSNLVALSQVTPGPIAVNAATYVGFQYAGVPGAAAATLGISLPSFILVIMIVHFMKKFKESQGVTAVLGGIRPATVGLLASAVVFLSETSLFNVGIFSTALFKDPAAYFNGLSILFFVVVVILFAKLKISPILLTVISGIAGAFIIR
jgi:chromate transporter